MKKFFYRVKKGETLLSICKEFSVPIMKVISDNKLEKDVCEGDILYIHTENRKVYSVLPCDDMESIAEKFCLSKKELMDINGIPYVFYGIDIYV